MVRALSPLFCTGLTARCSTVSSSPFPSLAIEPGALGEGRVSAFVKRSRLSQDDPDNPGNLAASATSALLGCIRAWRPSSQFGISDAKLVRSISRKACSPDNAACDGFFGRLKTEFFYPSDWKNTTLEQLINEVDGYIRWYNEKRIKISLGARSPIECRNSLGIVT
jgi:hypothetical protein